MTVLLIASFQICDIAISAQLQMLLLSHPSGLMQVAKAESALCHVEDRTTSKDAEVQDLHYQV